jgi:hypothetical protein
MNRGALVWINMKISHLPASRLLIESKYAVGVAVIGFLLALVLSHGSLMAGFGVLALIAGLGWAWQRIFSKGRPDE